jgi:hypothetical protein
MKDQREKFCNKLTGLYKQAKLYAIKHLSQITISPSFTIEAQHLAQIIISPLFTIDAQHLAQITTSPSYTTDTQKVGWKPNETKGF